jgi:hypothetical protein
LRGAGFLTVLLLLSCRVLAEEGGGLNLAGYEFVVGVNTQARVLTIEATLQLVNSGAEPVRRLRWVLPTGGQGGAVRIDGASVRASHEGRVYEVELPEPLVGKKVLALGVAYVLPDEGGGLARQWQVGQDTAMGWGQWYPTVAGVRDAAAPYRVELRTPAGMVPVTAGALVSAEQGSIVYRCKQRVSPFWVAGPFSYFKSRVGPMDFGIFRVLDVNDAVAGDIIAGSLNDAARMTGQVVGAPEWRHIKVVLLKEDQTDFEDRPFFLWLAAEWYESPARTRMNLGMVGTKVARLWFNDSWRPIGDRAEVLSWGLSSYFGYLTVKDRYGADDARALSLRFARTMKPEVFHGSTLAGRGLLPRAPAQLLGPSVHTMLAQVLGESVYHKALKELFVERRGKTVTIGELEKAVRDTGGVDVKWFFDQWVRGAALADYVLEREPKGVPWKGRVGTALAVANRGKGRMKLVIKAESLAGERVGGWTWLDGGQSKTVHLVTCAPLDRVELDPDKIVAQASTENDEWSNPRAGENPFVVTMKDGRVLKGKIVEEGAAAFKLDLGTGVTTVVRSRMAKLERTPYGAYLTALRAGNVEALDHLKLARMCDQGGWGYEARFHALWHLTKSPGDREATAIAEKYDR